MKTAKEMLVIANAVIEERDNNPYGEIEIMALIANEAAKGETSVYVGWMFDERLIPKLEAHGYSISESIYENRDEGIFERSISWDCEE